MGYRLELSVATEAKLGRAPDGIPFAWLYSPWEETPVCRTTDFGVIHHGSKRDGASVVAREIPDQGIKMYPVSWEEDRFERYLHRAADLADFIPLGRLGLYKYVTIDSTFAMIERLLEQLPRYLTADAGGRYNILKNIRGDWSD